MARVSSSGEAATWRNTAMLIDRGHAAAGRAGESIAGFAQETAIRRTSEGFVGPNALLGLGLGLYAPSRCDIIGLIHQWMHHCHVISTAHRVTRYLT